MIQSHCSAPIENTSASGNYSYQLAPTVTRYALGAMFVPGTDGFHLREACRYGPFIGLACHLWARPVMT